MGTTNKPSRKSVKLPRDLRVSSAGAAYAALAQAAAARENQIALDAREVEKADAAGLQALVAGCRLVREAGKRVIWLGRSTQLDAAAGLLGLAEALESAE